MKQYVKFEDKWPLAVISGLGEYLGWRMALAVRYPVVSCCPWVGLIAQLRGTVNIDVTCSAWWSTTVVISHVTFKKVL